ncbi:hypothetical protein [Limoniibacter endophyticus]|uniref:hypothetical protein n=1 Tax=Limoniibacter endophyticus TaxID=1565040 RepID=UPI00167954E3|nr:hypothetical protein [Limoniibacter endophyticus]
MINGNIFQRDQDKIKKQKKAGYKNYDAFSAVGKNAYKVVFQHGLNPLQDADQYKRFLLITGVNGAIK